MHTLTHFSFVYLYFCEMSAVQMIAVLSNISPLRNNICIRTYICVYNKYMHIFNLSH